MCSFKDNLPHTCPHANPIKTIESLVPFDS